MYISLITNISQISCNFCLKKKTQVVCEGLASETSCVEIKSEKLFFDKKNEKGINKIAIVTYIHILYKNYDHLM